jgi:hypothetical protein
MQTTIAVNSDIDVRKSTVDNKMIQHINRYDKTLQAHTD